MEARSIGRIASACLLLAAPLCAVAQSASPPLEIVRIFGNGQTRQVQNITRRDLAEALPGTSPLKTLQKLPGVSFQSSDAFGGYEWSTRLSVRGFSQGQLGFTLDGIPLGNMSYGNNNGLHISRAISPENIRQVDLSQGSGAVGTASTSNLGGAVQFLSSDPADGAAINASQTFGSNATRRTFARVDSGLLEGGAKLYASVLRQHARKWKGEGPQDLTQFNSKWVQQAGPHRLSAFYNYSDRTENDYQDLSLDMRDRLGWDWDNYAPDWNRAIQAARGVFTGGVNNLDDAYYTARGLRKDHLAGATLDLDNTEAGLHLKTTAYYHGNQGQGHWYTPYAPSSAQVPVSIRTTEYGVSRHGLIADLSWTAGNHAVNGGAWVERNRHDLVRNFYAVSGPDDTNRFLSDPMRTGFMQQFRVRTTQFYVQDTLTLLDNRLRLNAGLKHPSASVEASSINEVRAAGVLSVPKRFLPQFGINYDLNKDNEIFFSTARNLRAFEAGVYGQFSQNQQAFNAGGAQLRPETSTGADLGLRFRRPGFSGSVALYKADFRDRLLSVATCAGVVGCPNTVVNVGRVATSGMEAAASWSITPALVWFNSATLNRSRYGSDYMDGAARVAVSGKQVVDTPARLMHTELAFDNKRWFAKMGGKYTARRYYTYLNDGAVPAYTVWDLSGGMRRGNLTLQVHVNNLFNKRYFSTVGSNQFVASDPRGQFATLLSGAPRELFVTISGKLH